MDYEKKYKEALERARIWKDKSGMPKDKRGILDEIFPELAESEDERIVKCLLNYFNHVRYNGLDLKGTDVDEVIAWLEKQKPIELNQEMQVEPQDKGEISDGYHTFNELYYYRMLYNAAFFNMLPKEWVHKSKKHNDGEECFGGGWFIVMANLPTGQISNHYELKDWDLFQIPEKEVADEWDGHTPQEATERLHKFLLEKQGQTFTKKDVDDAYLKGVCDTKHELEKQGEKSPVLSNSSNTGKDEQKEIDYNEELKKCKDNPLYFFDKYVKIKLKEQKPAWSEEDEERIKNILSVLDVQVCWNGATGKKENPYQKEIDWVKSLKDRIK